MFGGPRHLATAHAAFASAADEQEATARGVRRVALALRRIVTLKEQNDLIDDIDEIYYWACFADYLSPWKALVISRGRVEGSGPTLANDLGGLGVDQRDLVIVPEISPLRPGQIPAVECQQMIGREDSIAFMAIPKHGSFYIQAVEIPLTLLEAATATSFASGIKRRRYSACCFPFAPTPIAPTFSFLAQRPAGKGLNQCVTLYQPRQRVSALSPPRSRSDRTLKAS